MAGKSYLKVIPSIHCNSASLAAARTLCSPNTVRDTAGAKSRDLPQQKIGKTSVHDGAGKLVLIRLVYECTAAPVQ
jgi:hypothetical protein